MYCFISVAKGLQEGDAGDELIRQSKDVNKTRLKLTHLMKDFSVFLIYYFSYVNQYLTVEIAASMKRMYSSLHGHLGRRAKCLLIPIFKHSSLFFASSFWSHVHF